MVITSDDEYLVTLETCPNFEYMRLDSPATNQVGLYNKTTFKKYFEFNLQKEEDPNCIIYCHKLPFGDQF